MKQSALEGREGNLVLFEDLHREARCCLFCGLDRGDESWRWMCFDCRKMSIWEALWKARR